MKLERVCSSLKRAFPTSVFPAKAGTQIHPVSQQGFTWASAFAGETEEEETPAPLILTPRKGAPRYLFETLGGKP